MSTRADNEVLYRELMGETVGPMYGELHSDVVWLHAQWVIFRQLYADSQERIDLLYRLAPMFFLVIRDTLWHDVLMRLGRLSDPAQSCGKDNLSLAAMVEAINDQTLRAQLDGLLVKVDESCEFVRDWRNKQLAHRDLAQALQADATPLPAVSRDNIEAALESVRALMNALELHYFGAETAYRDVVMPGDGESLAYYLAEGERSPER